MGSSIAREHHGGWLMDSRRVYLFFYSILLDYLVLPILPFIIAYPQLIKSFFLFFFFLLTFAYLLLLPLHPKL